MAYCLPKADPVQKVSIIPRGLAALGYTLQRPEGDRYLMTQSELEARIQVALAGSVAEEMIFHDLSTGAQSDIQRATEIARAMVMDFGMSRLGRIALREHRHNFLFGRPMDWGEEKPYSEQTAREIDMEIRRIVEEALAKTRNILEVHRQALEALAERLMQKEVLDTQELRKSSKRISPEVRSPPRRDSYFRRRSPAKGRKHFESARRWAIHHLSSRRVRPSASRGSRVEAQRVGAKLLQLPARTGLGL